MKVLIIEDEMIARKSLESILAANFPDTEIVGECSSVKDSVAWLSDKSNKADIIFMDVELSDGECFEIFRQVQVPSHVVMTTAYDSYAVKAFEAGSIDYLLKPIELSSLKRAVERCVHSTGNIDIGNLLSKLKREPAVQYKERFLVHFNDRIVPVKTGDISFFCAEAKINRVVTRDGAFFIVDDSLDTILAELDPERFFKISRSCIIAKDAVQSITKLMGGRLDITPNVVVSRNFGPAPDLTVSRSRTDDFLIWMEN